MRRTSRVFENGSGGILKVGGGILWAISKWESKTPGVLEKKLKVGGGVLGAS